MASNQGGNKGSDNKGNKQRGDTSNRGFASMDPQKQREIASEGGKAAHASGNAHEFTSEEARRAGSMSHKNDGNSQSQARRQPAERRSRAAAAPAAARRSSTPRPARRATRTTTSDVMPEPERRGRRVRGTAGEIAFCPCRSARTHVVTETASSHAGGLFCASARTIHEQATLMR